jgi:membrane-bound serine protease (ClpP class)
MRPFLRAFVLFLSIFLFSVGTASAYTVFQIQLDDDTINPVTAEFIEESITAATRANAQCLIIKLDTPGGLLSSTRTIVKNIMKSKTPVVVYIAPAGSRAGSAGTFITYASHVAAMAPSTNIGAAHPVQMNGFGPGRRDEGEELRKLIEDIREIKEQEAKNSGKEEKAQSVTPLAEEKTEAEKAPEESKALQGTEVPENDDDPMTSKIVNDTTAFIRAISEERGRNTEWAVKSVVESESIISSEALEKGVIDLIAVDDKDLLEKLDGRTIKLTTGTVTLHTKDASVQILRMDARQKFFNVLANPNIAYILLMLGFFGLLFEVTHPGVGFPGIAGAICLILAFYSMQTLPTNYAGVALIALGVVLLGAEAFVPGFGALFLSGLVSLSLGAMLMFNSIDPIMRVSMQIVFITGLTLGVLMLFLLKAMWQIFRQRTSTGKEGLIGEIGKVDVRIEAGKEGKVFVHGELWNATAETTIETGEKVRVVRLDGLLITVERVD